MLARRWNFEMLRGGLARKVPATDMAPMVTNTTRSALPHSASKRFVPRHNMHDRQSGTRHSLCQRINVWMHACGYLR